MSNPLLQPDDRFQRPTIPSGAANPFQDRPDSEAGPEAEILPVRPEAGSFETVYNHRGWTVLGLAIGTFLAVILSSLAFMGGPQLLVFFAILALPPGVLAWRLGADDLRAMDAGAMDRDGEQITSIGMWLGIVGLGLALLMLLASVGLLVLLLIQIF